MKTCFHLCLIVGAALGLAVGVSSQPDQKLKVIHLSGANFREAPGQALFSHSGKLYAAYRLPGKDGTSLTLRIAQLDPVAGQQVDVHDYAVPSVRLPRVASALLLSQDDSTLAYAELHSPQIVLTIEAPTLKPLSTSETGLFGEQDFAPHVSTLSSNSLVLSAGGLAHKGKAISVHEIRKISLNPRNLQQVLSEKVISPDDDLTDLSYWHKRIRTQREVGQIVLVNDGVLGLTNMIGEGWIQLFDRAGNELATLHNPECGFVRASLSPDQLVGVAECVRTGLDEPQFGQTLQRDAVVFEVMTLKVIATIPMSRASVKERGSVRGDLWVASPSCAVWRGKQRVLVAVSDFPDSINVYSIPATTATAH